MVITCAWMLNYLQLIPIRWRPCQLCLWPYTLWFPPTRRFSSGSWSAGHDYMLVGPAQSKYSPSVSTTRSVLLLLQITWLSMHTKLILSAGEEIYSLKLKSLPKGKGALTRKLWCSFTACDFSISFSKFCNSTSKWEPKRPVDETGRNTNLRKKDFYHLPVTSTNAVFH